jgi:hypothetical protein
MLNTRAKHEKLSNYLKKAGAHITGAQAIFYKIGLRFQTQKQKPGAA